MSGPSMFDEPGLSGCVCSNDTRRSGAHAPSCPHYSPSPPHNSTPTSKAAAASMAGSSATVRGRVLDCIIQAGPVRIDRDDVSGGRTAHEIAEALDLSGDTVRPRIWELAAKNRKSEEPALIAESGATRKTPSGRRAVVWEAVR